MLAQTSGEVQVAPHNIDAEQGLLGAILINPEAYVRVAGFIQAGHFYDPLHQRIYRLAEQMIAGGKDDPKPSPITLAPYFETETINPTLTVKAYLGRLAARAAILPSVADYGREVRKAFVSRRLVAIGEDLAARARVPDVETTPEALIEQASTELFDLTPKASNERASVSAGEAARRAVVRSLEASERGGGLAGLSTGFADLDAKMGGLRDGNLIIIAGRPAMGKSALGLNIGEHVAKAGVPVALFSLEMSIEQLGERLVAGRTEIAIGDIANGDTTPAQKHALDQAYKGLADLPLTIDDTGGLSVAQLRSKANRLWRRRQLGLIIVDYLQLMEPHARLAEFVQRTSQTNRTQDVTAITNGLKAIAKEFNVPVIALSQLNRAVENRDNKRPQLSDLRDSGSIEQDADVVLFCYREEYYVEQRQPDAADEMAEWTAQLKACAGKAEIIIGKNRQNATGRVDLAWHGATATFKSLARTARAGYARARNGD